MSLLHRFWTALLIAGICGGLSPCPQGRAQSTLRWKQAQEILQAVGPGGQVVDEFAIQPGAAMPENLRRAWPQISCWTGPGTQHPEWTLHAAQHGGTIRGMIHRPGLSTLWINLEEAPSAPSPQHCAAHPVPVPVPVPVSVPVPVPVPVSVPVSVPVPVPVSVLRLALSCTGEYAAFHGGTVENALAAMVEAVTLANGIFGPEVGVQFQLVEETADLIHLDPATDPFNNANAVQMMTQNTAFLNAALGEAGYDIGHVFGTGFSSVAGLGNACGTLKAKGVSRAGAPTGLAFVLNPFCHELGHQIGATHTHLNPCSQHAPSAFEPASGSTLMSYAGLCAPDLQPQADPVFHAHSLHQIRSFLSSSGCPTSGPANASPTVHLPITHHLVPLGTPFELTAPPGIDPEFANLTYSWEQLDAGDPWFRSLPPTTSRTRQFPSIASDAVLGNTLPEEPGTMTFLCTVRDGNPTRGAFGFDTLSIEVVDTEAFEITSVTTSEDSLALTWHVAGTNLPPFNDTLVAVEVSLDGGLTFPWIWADNQANSGTALFPLLDFPAVDSVLLRVKPTGAVYFAVSPPVNVDGTPSEAVFGLSAELPNDSVCGHVISPSLTVHNPLPDSAAVDAMFVLTGTDQSREVHAVIGPGETTTLSTGNWWIGYGTWTIDATLNGSPFSASSFATGCHASCPACGCTSPQACNYDPAAAFPDGSCVMPAGAAGCDCATTLVLETVLDGSTTAEWNLGTLSGAPDSLFLSVDMNNEASPGSWAADFAFSLCNGAGNCVTAGGYNLSLPGTNLGPLPLGWQWPGSGIFEATFALPQDFASGTGDWTLTAMNGWAAAGDVNYTIELSIPSLCAIEAATACAGNLNGDGVVNVADLLFLLGAIDCSWGCPEADMTGDGVVNVADLLAFLGVYGNGC